MREMTPAEAVRRSLAKRFRKALWQPFVAACKRYALVPEGCAAAVLLDGTAPALLTALLLDELCRHSDEPFSLTVLAEDPEDPLAASLGLKPLPAGDDPRETARALGCGRFAETDCMSDATELLLTAMLTEGETRGLLPREEKGGLTVIRPLYCVERRDIRAFCRYNGLSLPLPEPDPRRAAARDLLETVKRDDPDAEKRVFRAMHAVHADTFPREENRPPVRMDGGDAGSGVPERRTAMHDNPILYADFPDPDVIRVGDTYYMASTTMHMFPGCEILRSYNLCDWEPVCRVFASLDGTPAQRLAEGDIYGQGMWAPSLRRAGGVFHILFAANDTRRCYHFTAPAIEGPWTERPIAGFYHDASVLFDDDGRVFIAHGNRVIRLTEMRPDLTEPLPGGFDGVIVRDGDAEAYPLGYEGSHLQKIGGTYVLSLIHWPKCGNGRRTQALYRADRPEGPWTGGDVLDDDLGFHNRGVAQGGLIDTPDGRLYAMLFQDHGAAGRMPVLVPVRREGGQPVFGHVPARIDPPDSRPGHVYAPLAGSDDFTGERLSALWQWNHQPDDSLWRLDPAAGTLTLTAGRAVTDLEHAPNTLTQRTFGPRCACEVTVDAAGLNNGDYAGLCALQGRFAQIAVCRQDGQFFLSMIARDEEARELAWVPLEGKRARLRAEFDFTDMRDEVRFLWRTDGDWQPLGPAHHLVYDLHHFMGVRAGLFCYATKRGGGQAVFSDFRFAAENP